MDARNTEIIGFLSSKDITFFIPPYQRNYEWNKEMCDIFYKDIEKVANNINAKHFFGTIIYYEEKGHVAVDPYKLILVDGQQRITTIMLFLIAVRDLTKDEEFKKLIDKKYLRNDNVRDSEVEYKIKLKQVESDWKSYKKLVLADKLDEREKESIIYKNYQFFKSKLGKLDRQEMEKLLDGLRNFEVVTIQLKPSENKWEKPQEIFESMNSLGKPLSLADLVRNYLLLGKSSEDQEELYRRYWLKIEKNLNGANGDFSVSSFIRDYMQMEAESPYKKAREVNYKELYQNFKDLFKNIDSKELIEKLSLSSEDYSILARSGGSGNEKIDKKISDLKMLECSAFNSFILGLFEKRRTKLLNDNDCLAILDAIFVYIARRRILGVTQAENMHAPKLIKHIETLIESNDKRGKMLSILANQFHRLRLPNDGEVRSHLLSENSNFYNIRVCKFIFSLIEEHLTKSRPVDDNFLQKEHIMPQTLNKSWEDMLGNDYENIYNRLLNNIGNLTLIRHNQGLGNKSFDEKKKIYRNNAGMQIAKDKILDKEKWGKNEIMERAEYLIGILTDEVFPLPPEMKESKNYSQEEQKSGALSFEELDLIGKYITYFDDTSVTAYVTGDKTLEFEGEEWRLSPLTREIERRKKRMTPSGAYWGVDKWTYGGKTLKQLMDNMDEDEE